MWTKCVNLSPVKFLRSFKYNDLHFENPTTAKNEQLSKYGPNSAKTEQSHPFSGGMFQPHV